MIAQFNALWFYVWIKLFKFNLTLTKISRVFKVQSMNILYFNHLCKNFQHDFIMRLYYFKAISWNMVLQFAFPGVVFILFTINFMFLFLWTDLTLIAGKQHIMLLWMIFNWCYIFILLIIYVEECLMILQSTNLDVES